MTLKVYRKKRDFTKTSEPSGKNSGANRHNLFVIQKHAASHLHYDFRIALQGVLKSWAVPKGPCLDPSVKRLAVHVEDHPLAYGSFEGIIPKGEYGGGSVQLWDTGTWRSLDNDPVKALDKGHIRMEISGEKLHGRWDLIRFKDEKNWFLVKYQDKYAKKLNDYDITEAEPLSILSHLAVEDIAKTESVKKKSQNRD